MPLVMAGKDRFPRLCFMASGPPRLSPCRGRAGSGDQGGIDEHVLPHRHALRMEVSLDGVDNLLAQPELLQQVWLLGLGPAWRSHEVGIVVSSAIR